MRVLLFTYILSGFVPHGLVFGTNLSAPTLPYGKWGEWEFCKGNTVARGFRIKVNFPWTNYFDNKGLTGIQLLCGNTSFPNYDNAPTSTYGIGNSQWQGVKMCGGESYITSFDLRQERDDSWYILDRSGATNLRVKCSDGSILEGDGVEDKGVYHGWLHCMQGEGICGLTTKYDDGSEHYIDSLGLATVKMVCCPIGIENMKPINGTSFLKSENESNISLPNTTSILKPYAGLNPVDFKKPSNATILTEEKKLSAGIGTINSTVLKKEYGKEINPETQVPSKSHNISVTPASTALGSGLKNGTVIDMSANGETKHMKVSTLHTIAGFRDPYSNIPVALEVLILLAAGIFFFFAGFFFKKLFSAKYKQKSYQWTMKDDHGKMDPAKFTEIDISK